MTLFFQSRDHVASPRKISHAQFLDPPWGIIAPQPIRDEAIFLEPLANMERGPVEM